MPLLPLFFSAADGIERSSLSTRPLDEAAHAIAFKRVLRFPNRGLSGYDDLFRQSYRSVGRRALG